MSSHRIVHSPGDRLSRLAPFGLGHTKPKHFRDMLKVVWANRDNLGYAWKVLNRGVCDGCALGVAGLHDWTIDGVHLCMTRLNLLRLNTMPAMDPTLLADVAPLRGRDNRTLRDLGRLAHPMRRRRGEKGFTRIGWDEALAAIGARPARHRRAPHGVFRDRARRHQRDLLHGAEGCAFPRDQQRRQRGAPLPLAVDGRDETHARPRRDDLQLHGLDGFRPRGVLRLQPGQRPARLDQIPAHREGTGDEGRARESLLRTRHEALLGAVDGEQRALRVQPRRLLVSGRAGWRHLFSVRRAQTSGRDRQGRPHLHRRAHDGLGCRRGEGPLARLGRTGQGCRPVPREHRGVCRACGQCAQRGLSLEHGHHAAPVGRGQRAHDPQRRARPRLPRPRQMRRHAHPRPLVGAGRRRDGRVRDGLPRRQDGQRRQRRRARAALRVSRAGLAGAHDDRDGRGGLSRRVGRLLPDRRQLPADTPPIPTTWSARWATCRSACTRTSCSPTRC